MNVSMIIHKKNRSKNAKDKYGRVSSTVIVQIEQIPSQLQDLNQGRRGNRDLMFLTLSCCQGSPIP